MGMRVLAATLPLMEEMLLGPEQLKISIETITMFRQAGLKHANDYLDLCFARVRTCLGVGALTGACTSEGACAGGSQLVTTQARVRHKR